jgi:hypothetical protein
VEAANEVQDIMNFFPVLLEEEKAETTQQAIDKQVNRYNFQCDIIIRLQFMDTVSINDKSRDVDCCLHTQQVH